MTQISSRLIVLVGLTMFLCGAGAAHAADANRLTYLDQFCDPYWPGLKMPKLITPQWIGEEGVECVITIGIDDMRSPAPYEAYLRPILKRLKEVDGRGPVSIMTNSIDPKHPQLARPRLKEGLSLETHTADHPCPCLQGGSFDVAKETYDRCVDQLASVPGNRPVAFRFPCMDSMNTPSPRGFAEIFNQKTPQGNFLEMSTSVCQLFTPDDPVLPRELVYDGDGERFARYLPFPSFVNKVENYPYPYVIGRVCWEFACMVPDDWHGQNLFGNANRQTAIDYMAAIDATVLKQGVANLVCHPSDWIGNQLLLRVVDQTLNKHGRRVKFLTFPEALQRINEHLLAGQSIRAADGGDNGVRLLDLNNDGYLDVVIGNDQLRRTRVWLPEERTWRETDYPAAIVKGSGDERRNAGVRFGVLRHDGMASMLVLNESVREVWHFDGREWQRDDAMVRGLESGGTLVAAVDEDGRDLGLRLRDADGDGICEVLVGSRKQRDRLRWDPARKSWQSAAPLPEPIVDAQGRDAGLRFVDLDYDGRDDLVFSNESRYAVYIYSENEAGWTDRGLAGSRSSHAAVPMIVRRGTNNGAWFANGHMWLQNEDTNRLPDGVDRRTFEQLLGEFEPPARSPQASLRSMRPRPGFTVELVAAEPLVKDPIAFDWGPDGRLWVVEMADYPLGVDGGGRVRYLEDTTGDGKYDKSTVFLDGLPYPTGVMPWREGVLISAAPDILFAADTDGDGRADPREVLYHGFVEGNQQHRVNGFDWGLDNWAYVANGDSGGEITSIKTGTTLNISGRDLRIRPDSGAIDLQTGFTQYGRHRDDWGNWFGGNNSLPLRHYVLADQYLRRNPHARPPSPHNDIAATGNTQIFPVSRVLSHWEGYRTPGPGEPHLFTSACGATPYRDELFGPEFYGNTFTCEPVHNLVHRRQLIPDGVTFGSRRPDDETSREFLASTDSWFRPTTVRPGPDGALWIADMYRLVIEHTEYIGDAREQELDLPREDRGRIYRVYPQQAELRPIPRLGELSTAALAAALDSPSGWQRDTVQRLLIHRGDRAAIQPLQKMLRHSGRPLARLHALCTLDGLGAATEETLLAALADPHPGVRRHAVRLAESHLPNSAALTKRLVAMVDAAASADAHLRLQLAYSLGNAPDPAAGEALARLAHENRSDPYLRAAVVSSLNEQNLPTVLAAALKSGLEDEAGQALFGELLQMAAAMKSASTIDEAIGHISQADQDAAPQRWQFEALASLLAGLGKDATPSAPLLRDVSEQISLFREKAKSAAVDPDAEPSLRQAAVNLLGRSHRWADSEEIELLAQLLEPIHADQLQRAVLEALAARDDPQVAPAVLQKLGQMSPALRAQALDQLLSRFVWIDALLSELESERLPLKEIGSSFRTRLLTYQDEALRGRAEALFTAVNSDRQAVIEAYRESLTAEGDVARGELLFAKHCGTCHRLGDVGKQVGPDLAAITDRSPAAMLVSVLDPNRAVEDKYRSYNVLTDDGRARSGIIIAETSTTITLKNAQGKEEVILRNEIDALQNTGSSLMPSGIEKELDVHKMADVLSFVRAQRPPPKSFAGNQPQQVLQGQDGVITLAAADCRIYGDSLVFESRYGNLGYWMSANDEAEWLVEVSRAGDYEVTIDYACDNSTAGNIYALRIGQDELVGSVEGTGTWDDYQTIELGRITLDAGLHHLVFRPQRAPEGCLIDLRTVILRPVAASQSTQ